jgi:hypothetical protein
MRDQIRDSLGLFDLAKKHPELADASADLAKVITIQAGRLLGVIEPDRPRRWDWGQFGVGIGFSAGIAWAEWAAWSHRSSWWGVPALWIGAAFLVVVLLVSFQSLFERRSAAA